MFFKTLSTSPCKKTNYKTNSALEVRRWLFDSLPPRREKKHRGPSGFHTDSVLRAGVFGQVPPTSRPCKLLSTVGNSVVFLVPRETLENWKYNVYYTCICWIRKMQSIHIIHNLSLILLQYLFSTCMRKLIHVLYLKKSCIAYLHILFAFLNSVKSCSSIGFFNYFPNGSFTYFQMLTSTSQTHQSPWPAKTRVICQGAS